MDEGASMAMLEAVKSFATELATLRTTEAEARNALLRDVQQQMTAVRHDVFGSIAYLSQEVAALQNQQEKQHTETIAYRAEEREGRKFGQQVTRGLLIVILAIVLIVAVRVLYVAVRG